jgi:hypothetical protein
LEGVATSNDADLLASRGHPPTLTITPYAEAGERLVSSTTLEAAKTMSDPADLINRAIKVLLVAAIDLPAFSTLDRLVNRLRAEVHGRIFDRVTSRGCMPRGPIFAAAILAQA